MPVMTDKTFAAQTEKPRFTCRIVRLWSVLSGQPQSRHATTCAGCRSYFAALDDLESGLRRDAGVANASRSTDDFAQQIIRTIRAETSNPTRQAPSVKGRMWTFGGLAIAACLAFVVSLKFSPRSADRVIGNPSTADGAEVIVSAVQSLSSGLVDSVIPSAGELVATNPLQQELGSVYSDVRSALDFLALNFLPTTAAPDTAPRPRQI
jgi:hypothetical protein